MKKFFALEDAEAELLLDEARRQADHAVSLQTFTRRSTSMLSEREEQRVVEMLWQVALADRRLDKHEDYVVRQVAELLYVPHSDSDPDPQSRLRPSSDELAGAVYCSTKNCFLKRTVKRLGSLLGVTSIV